MVIRANDARLGRVLTRLDDRTAVFFISDHGQTGVRNAVDVPTEGVIGRIRGPLGTSVRLLVPRRGVAAHFTVAV